MKLLIVYEGSLRFLFYFILFYFWQKLFFFFVNWQKLIYIYICLCALYICLCGPLYIYMLMCPLWDFRINYIFVLVLVYQYLAKTLSSQQNWQDISGLNLIRHSLIRSSGLRVSPRLTYHICTNIRLHYFLSLSMFNTQTESELEGSRTRKL